MSRLEPALAYEQRGLAIVPVVFEGGKKRVAVRWKRFQCKAPSPRTVGKWFSDGRYPALAVILGPVSGNLACRDFDDPGAYETWAKGHPKLAKTLPTARTGRGYHVYFTAALERTVTCADGELRGGCGSTSVLPPSRHPSGRRYRWLIPLPAGDLPTVDPKSAGLLGEPVQQKRTEENRSRRKQTDANGSKLSAGEVGEDEVALAIQATLPTGPRQRNRQIFQFARALKGIASLANADAPSLRPDVQRWHAAALSVIETKEFEETWIDFLYAWDRVQAPMRLNLMEDAMKTARANPVPELPYEQAGVRDLVALCRELQGMWGREPFFLSCRTAGRVLGVEYTKAWRWLFLLEQDGWIRTAAKGGTRERPYQATRYRYLGTRQQASGKATGQDRPKSAPVRKT